MDKCYTEIISTIKTRLEIRFIYIAVDEKTDVCGSYIANLLVGILSENFAIKS